MWNLFRRKPAEESFPTPEWPPIQSLDSIDITGKRHDGGLDLVIVASQPIDGSPQIQPGQEDELACVGIVFGQVLAARTPLRWVTVEWQGARVLGLQYQNTTVIVFHGSMIAKRINRGERVEFASYLESVVAQVEQMKDDPEYQR